MDESLQFISEVRGIAQSQIEDHKRFIMKTLDLESFEKTQAQNLSGGNKRKLVCAQSLVGRPSVEFLDEPTTGVDPISRQSFYNMI